MLLTRHIQSCHRWCTVYLPFLLIPAKTKNLTTKRSKTKSNAANSIMESHEYDPHESLSHLLTQNPIINNVLLFLATPTRPKPKSASEQTPLGFSLQSPKAHRLSIGPSSSQRDLRLRLSSTQFPPFLFHLPCSHSQARPLQTLLSHRHSSSSPQG